MPGTRPIWQAVPACLVGPARLGRLIMDALTSLGERIPYIPSEPTPDRGVGGRRRLAFRVGAAGVAGLVTLFISVGIVGTVRESRRAACAVHLKRLGVALY